MKCFLCLKGNVDDKGICDNPDCPRSKPLNPPKGPDEPAEKTTTDE